MGVLNLDEPLRFRPHARSRMQQRNVTDAQVVEALRHYHTSYLVERSAGEPGRAMVYIGSVDGRDLKLWITPDSDPVEVRSVAWQGEGD